MSKRSETLAIRIKQGADELISFAEKLSATEWQTVCEGDERTVAVLVHHVAAGYLSLIALMRVLSAGNPIAGVTWEMVDGGNSQHAADNAEVGQQETLALLRKNSALAADAVRELRDEQLDSVSRVSLHLDVPLTTQFFIEEYPLMHPYRHLASMRAALTAARRA